MRFGIRSLLGLVAVATVLFAFVGEPYLRAERVRIAIELLTNSSKKAIRDESGDVVELTCDFHGYGYVVQRTKLPLDRIFALNKLQQLKLRHCSFDSLKPVARLNELHSLSIYNCEIGQPESGFSLPIKSLELAGEQYVDQLAELPDMPELVELKIVNFQSRSLKVVSQDAKFDSNGFDFLSLQRFPKLERVTIVGNAIDGFAGIEKLDNLDTLDLRNAEVYSTQGIENAKGLKSLTIGSFYMVGEIDQIEAIYALNQIADMIPSCKINGTVGPR